MKPPCLCLECYFLCVELQATTPDYLTTMLSLNWIAIATFDVVTVVVKWKQDVLSAHRLPSCCSLAVSLQNELYLLHWAVNTFLSNLKVKICNFCLTAATVAAGVVTGKCLTIAELEKRHQAYRFSIYWKFANISAQANCDSWPSKAGRVTLGEGTFYTFWN